MHAQIRTVDAQTGNLLPCRLSFVRHGNSHRWDKDAAGQDMAYLGEPRVWSTGIWAGDLPDEPVTIVAAHPYEYAAAHRVLTAADNGKVELGLERTCNMGSAGWFCGDAHQHVVHGEALLQVDLHTACRVARAEGADWMVFDGRFTSMPGSEEPTPRELHRICAECSDSGFEAFWADEYPKHDLGHLACLPYRGNLRPAEIGGEGLYRFDPDRRPPYTNFESIRALNRLGTTAVYVHPPRELGGTPERPGNIARELPLDTLVAPWAIEALDILSDHIDDPVCTALWYRLLNRGHRVGLCAFNDACYDRAGSPWQEPVAYRRTYVRFEPRHGMEGLVAGIRAGHTFGTTGPLLQFSVDNAGPGDSLPPSPEVHRVRLRAWSAPDYRDPRHQGGIRRAELIRNGEVAQVWEFGGAPPPSVDLTCAVESAPRTWLLGRVYGSIGQQLAVTSPVYVTDTLYAPPAALTIHVNGLVTDARTGGPLEGQLELVEYAHDRIDTRTTGAFENGRFALDLPGDLRVRVRVAGYGPQTLSPVLHSDTLYCDLLGRIRTADLARPAYYAELAAALRHVTLHFRLVPESG